MNRKGKILNLAFKRAAFSSNLQVTGQNSSQPRGEEKKEKEKEKNEKSEVKPPGLFDLEILQLLRGLIQGRMVTKGNAGSTWGRRGFIRGQGTTEGQGFSLTPS